MVKTLEVGQRTNTNQFAKSKTKQIIHSGTNNRRTDTAHGAVPNNPHIPLKKKKKKNVPWTQKIKITHGEEEEQEAAQAPKSYEAGDIPVIIRNDEKKVKLWEKATDEERLASEIICDFQATNAKTGISAYFDFADKWNEAFPNKRSYERGLSAVKKASRISGVSASTVYSILRTTKFYGRNGYESLAKKASVNGVILEWTLLRVIVNRLAENKEVRTEIEREIVQRKVTEAQLNAMIDERAPETIRTRAGQATKRSSLSLLDAFNVDLSKVVRSDEAIERAIQEIDDNYDTHNHEGNKMILKIGNKTLELFSKIAKLVNARKEQLQLLVDAVAEQVGEEAKQIKAGTTTKAVVKEKAALSKTKAAIAESVEAKAKRIAAQVANENKRAKEKEQARNERVALFGEFSDDNELQENGKHGVKNPAPIIDSLPDDDDDYNGNRGSVKSSKGVQDSDDEYEVEVDDEGEEEEAELYEAEEEEDEESDYDEEDEEGGDYSEEYNEDEADEEEDEFGDDEDSFSARDDLDIFDENGDIT
jgi:hypothetical protein